MPESHKMLGLQIDEAGKWTLQNGNLATFPFHPLESPPAILRGEMIKKIGTAQPQRQRW